VTSPDPATVVVPARDAASPAAGAGPAWHMTRRMVLRGGLLAAAAVPAAVAVQGTLIEPGRLVTTSHAFGSTSGPRLRIALVTDLHVRRVGGLERQLLERLHDSQPDLIAIVGDAIDRRAAIGHLDTLLGEFPRRPRTCAVMGNWEYNCGAGRHLMGRLYEKHGIDLLVNRFLDIEHEGRRVRITGLDDLIRGSSDARQALAAAEPVERHLALLHCPVHRDVMGMPREHPVSLVLSGHSHGGQVAPFGRPLVLPHGCGAYVAGWYHRAATAALYVSRGVGTSGIPVRLGAPPELALIDWRL